MSSDKGQKDRLKRLMQEVEQKGQEISEKSGEFAQFGYQVADMASAGQEVLMYVIPSRVDLQSKIETLQFVNQREDDILQRFTSIPIVIASASGTASAYEMMDFAGPDTVINFVEHDKQNEVRVAAQRLSAVIDRQADKNHVLSLMRQYDLSHASVGRKSPEELFQTAWAAFEKPVRPGSPASTSLIPMRECINATVEALRRRCPNQVKAKRSEKILSIGRQIVHSTIPWSSIQSLQNRHNTIGNDLSAAKQSDFTRETWGDLLRRATLFLRELLETLDRSKMR